MVVPLKGKAGPQPSPAWAHIIGYSGHTGLRCTVGAGVGRWDKPVWISRGPVRARQACVTAPSVGTATVVCSFVIAVCAERSSSERGAYEYAFSTRVAAERTERRGRRAPEAARSRTRTRSTCGKLGGERSGRERDRSDVLSADRMIRINRTNYDI